MVEEADIVILHFKGFDLALDKIIKHHKIVLNGAGNVEQKGLSHGSWVPRESQRQRRVAGRNNIVPLSIG